MPKKSHKKLLHKGKKSGKKSQRGGANRSNSKQSLSVMKGGNIDADITKHLKEYKIIEDNDTKSLQKQISDMQKEYWQLAGGFTFANGKYYQGMSRNIKYYPVEDTEDIPSQTLININNLDNPTTANFKIRYSKLYTEIYLSSPVGEFLKVNNRYHASYCNLPIKLTNITSKQKETAFTKIKNMVVRQKNGILDDTSVLRNEAIKTLLQGCSKVGPYGDSINVEIQPFQRIFLKSVGLKFNIGDTIFIEYNRKIYSTTVLDYEEGNHCFVPSIPIDEEGNTPIIELDK